MQRPNFYEFFAGGGMARAGLGSNWHCLFANDFDPKKAESYTQNWGAADLLVGDVAAVKPNALPGRADLAWASFPCQDLSLAGDYQGLSGERSGTFWPFWRLMRALSDEGRAPRIIVLENVYGALTSRSGEDFNAIAKAFSGAGYRFGALVVDARLFVPQSRPRLFVVGVHPGISIPVGLRGSPQAVWHPPSLVSAYERLSNAARSRWVWWALSTPAKRNTSFLDILEERPTVLWHTKDETAYLISLMSDVNREKLSEAIKQTKRTGGRMVGGVYRRTRAGVQRAEVRFDQISGCLRTPAGGSSRQTILLVERGRVRSRLLSPREGARLMGLPDSYKIPTNYNQAYHLVGDGVVVPAVRHLAQEIIEPILLGVNMQTVSIAAE